MFAKEDIIDGLGKGGRTPDCRVSGLLEPRAGADDLQRPLRSRFRARLTASVLCSGVIHSQESVSNDKVVY